MLTIHDDLRPYLTEVVYMAQQELIEFLSRNDDWYLSKDLVGELNISRTAIIRALTKLSDGGMLMRKPLKLKGYAYKINPRYKIAN